MRNYYTLNDENTIVEVGGTWDDFALDNDGPAAVADQVIGRPLWDFVKGFELVSFLSAVNYAVRDTGSYFETLYRCDSPDSLRLFRMTVSRLARDGLQVRHTLIKQSPTSLAAGSTQLDGFRCENRCSKCCRFRVGEQWIDSYAYPDTELFPQTHVICPICRAKAGDSLGEIINIKRAR